MNGEDSGTIPNHFDRGKPFYPLVILYLVQLMGFKELAVRGVVGDAHTVDIDDWVDSRSEKDPDVDPEAVEEVRTGLQKLIGPLQLRSQVMDDHIEVPPEFVASEVSNNVRYLAYYQTRASSHLLVLAHELTKGEPYRDQGPLWEFLRHCRNAAAHGGQFHFLGDEPTRTAEWAGLEMTRGLQGENLLKDESGEGLLSPGDPVRLLWDIEQAYPGMRGENPFEELGPKGSEEGE